jgi:hypothetical protein
MCSTPIRGGVVRGLAAGARLHGGDGQERGGEMFTWVLAAMVIRGSWGLGAARG